jgi:Na+-driven multidrug efflux pump
MGVAVTTLVGQRLGAGDPQQARAYGWEGLRLAWLAMASLGIVFLLAPEPILRIFTDDAEVISTGVPVLRILGLSQFLDPFNVVMQGVLTGAGKTLYVMLSEVGVMWLLMLPLTWYWALSAGLGYMGAWAAFMIYIVALAALTVGKFLGHGWETTAV